MRLSNQKSWTETTNTTVDNATNIVMPIRYHTEQFAHSIQYTITLHVTRQQKLFRVTPGHLTYPHLFTLIF